jgi:hypothetical protein
MYLCAQKIIMHKEMEATKTKPKNFVPRLLQFKREMRECIQNGADHEEMKRIADKYGFTFATPL